MQISTFHWGSPLPEEWRSSGRGKGQKKGPAPRMTSTEDDIDLRRRSMSFSVRDPFAFYRGTSLLRDTPLSSDPSVQYTWGPMVILGGEAVC